MPANAHFGPELFEFLEELRDNNRRDWFQANKQRYLRDVRDPMLGFISDFGPMLEKISPRFRADPRPAGGSLFRIYRDVRFSKDKSPYKTHVAARFNHERAKDVHAPGFYLHLGPDQVYCAIGIWHPDGPSLKAIRETIAGDGKGWRRILDKPSFGDAFTQGGESLKRGPKGFDPEHPMIGELKRKDYIASIEIKPEAALAPDFLQRYAEACRLGGPYVRYLTRALDLEW
ncbi:MAG: DUF2461 domain-containing protein [Thermoanaerobaculia bacterium]